MILRFLQECKLVDWVSYRTSAHLFRLYLYITTRVHVFLIYLYMYTCVSIYLVLTIPPIHSTNAKESNWLFIILNTLVNWFEHAPNNAWYMCNMCVYSNGIGKNYLSRLTTRNCIPWIWMVCFALPLEIDKFIRCVHGYTTFR